MTDAKNIICAMMEDALRSLSSEKLGEARARLTAYRTKPEIFEMIHGNGFSITELDHLVTQSLFAPATAFHSV
jgi:hypothetical protein